MASLRGGVMIIAMRKEYLARDKPAGNMPYMKASHLRHRAQADNDNDYAFYHRRQLE